MTFGYGERWRFDDSPSIFEALTFSISAFGLLFNERLIAANEITARAARDSAAAAVGTAAAARAQADAATMKADAAVVSNALSRESQRARLTVSVKVVREPSEDRPFAAWEMPITITGSSEAIRVRMAATTRSIKVGTPAPSVDNETWTNADWTNAGVVSIGEQNRSLRTDFCVPKNQASQYAAGVLQGVRWYGSGTATFS